MLNDAYRLQKIKNDRDIKSLSKAQFPGPHCPLFGAIMTASYVEDLTLLVIGTEECTYYGKDFAMLRRNGQGNVYSAVLEQHDITFGCEEDLKEIVKKIDREEKPKALMVITTCVIELIGEDIPSLLYSLKDEVEMTLLVVKTEHFKCNSHIEGMERALEELYLLMTSQTRQKKTVNILGFKYAGIEKTELYTALTKRGIKVTMTIPTKTTIETIHTAPASFLNIVVEPTALRLAKKMKEEFGIPYVKFPTALDLNEIVEAYHEIGRILGIDFSQLIAEKYEAVSALVDASMAELAGKTFIYGNTPFNCFQFSDFLIDLGMKPLIIQCRELYDGDREVMDQLISKRANPYIVRMANVAPLRRLYGELKPDYYFGHESPMLLAKHGIKHIVTDKCAQKIGFEKVAEVMRMIDDDVMKVMKMKRDESHKGLRRF